MFLASFREQSSKNYSSKQPKPKSLYALIEIQEHAKLSYTELELGGGQFRPRYLYHYWHLAWNGSGSPRSHMNIISSHLPPEYFFIGGAMKLGPSPCQTCALSLCYALP